MPSPNSSSHGKKSELATAAAMDNRLPTCRNYWRFGSSPSPPQRPPSYLLKPHLIAQTFSFDEDGKGRNPNSKYYKLRHGPGALKLSPLSDDAINYRVRLPFDPTPFRGISRFAFWLVFLCILIFLLVLITALFRVDDLHNSNSRESDISNLTNVVQNESEGSLKNSLIFQALRSVRKN